MQRIHRTETGDRFIQVISQAARPLSLEEIHQEIRKLNPAVAFSTIYRLAKKLEEHGAVTRIDWRERGSRYELTGGRHHHHIVCTRCGHSADVFEAGVHIDPSVIQKTTGFRIAAHYIEFEGTCARCLESILQAD